MAFFLPCALQSGVYTGTPRGNRKNLSIDTVAQKDAGQVFGASLLVSGRISRVDFDVVAEGGSGVLTQLVVIDVR